MTPIFWVFFWTFIGVFVMGLIVTAITHPERMRDPLVFVMLGIILFWVVKKFSKGAKHLIVNGQIVPEYIPPELPSGKNNVSKYDSFEELIVTEYCDESNDNRTS